jgi:CBS domain-containing protein
MTRPVQVFDSTHPLTDALEVLARLPVRVAPVVTNGDRFVGLFVKADGLKALERGDNDSRVGDVCRNGLSVEADAPFDAILSALRDAGVGRLPVVDGGTLVGEISRNDIRYYRERQRADVRLDERSKIRWRESRPGKALTWGIELSGEAFVAKAESYGAFGPGNAILEIGPGYGRLLRSILDRELQFERYVAVDLSATNVRHLKRLFDREEIEVIQADIEQVSLDETFDVVLSSLTLKHMYPSFEAALRNVARHLNPGAKAIFDLKEGESTRYTPDIDYMRVYSRPEVEEILSAVPLELVAFDEVEHAPGWTRLLVVARKPG